MHLSGTGIVAMLIIGSIGFVLAANPGKINDRYVAYQARIWKYSSSTSEFLVKGGRVFEAVVGIIAFSFIIGTIATRI